MSNDESKIEQNKDDFVQDIMNIDIETYVQNNIKKHYKNNSC